MSNDFESETFHLNQYASQNAYWSLIAGIALVVIALLGFGFALMMRGNNEFLLHASSTLPMILATGCLSNYWRLRNCPKSIGLGEHGIVVTRQGQDSEYRWDDLGWVSISDMSLNPSQKKMTIYNAAGKSVVVVPDSIKGFERLSSELQQRVADNNPALASSIQLKKARRTALSTGLFACVALAGSVFSFNMARETAKLEALLASEGIETRAKLTERFLAPDGVTTRVKIQATDETGGVAEHNFEVTQDYYDRIADAAEVDVVMARSSAKACRLVDGQVLSKVDSPSTNYWTAAGLAVIGLGCIAAAILFWSGYDFVADPETKQFGLRRIGEPTRNSS